MKFRTQYNSSPTLGEKNNGKSLTIPDKAFTIPQLLKMAANGISLPMGKVPLYRGDDDLPDLTHMDLAEREVAVKQYAQELIDLKNKIKLREEKFNNDMHELDVLRRAELRGKEADKNADKQSAQNEGNKPA